MQLKVQWMSLVKERMQETGMTRSELAHVLGKSKSHITQLLSVNANPCLSTIADVCDELGLEVYLAVRPKPNE